MAIVQWFPGHMAKTLREIKENIHKIDVVIEVLDGRIPLSSRNPLIGEIVAKKPLLILLNKCDLADGEILKEWEKYFRQLPEKATEATEETEQFFIRKVEAFPVSAFTGKNISAVKEKCRTLCRKEHWFGKRALCAMIIGVPNVGKSALLNSLVGKKKQAVENRPGVTRELKKIRLSDSFHLLDTPGVLWHKFEDQLVGEKLAILGSIKESILSREEIALKGVELLKELYPVKLEARYKIEAGSASSLSPEELFLLIGRKRGCLISGGRIDGEKTANVVLSDIREGRLGCLCLEKPNM